MWPNHVENEWQPSNRLQCYTNDTTLAILYTGFHVAAGSVCRGKRSATYQLGRVKVTVAGEWMSDLFDMSVQSQRGVVQTLHCVNTGQSNLVWLITAFNQVKFTSVHANWKRNPSRRFQLRGSCRRWQLGQVYHPWLNETINMRVLNLDVPQIAHMLT